MKSTARAGATSSLAGWAARWAGIAGIAGALSGAALAQGAPDSLWLGTDNTNTLAVLNVTKSGAVVRSIPPREATGLAIPPGGSQLYVSTSVGATITRYNLGDLSVAGTLTQTPNASFGEDMAADATWLYRADVLGNAVLRVDPASGASTPFISANSPIGIAYTGTFFYVSEFNTGVVRQYTTAGAPTGVQFTPGPLSGPIGGLAWDSCTGTLWVGSLSRVYNVNPNTGAILSSFATPELRFADGLEYQAGVCAGQPAAVSTPVPTLSETALLLLGLLLALAAAARLRGRTGF